MAMFEYATLLNVKYGKQIKVSVGKNGEEEEKVLKRCHKIDFYALRVFIVTYFLTIGMYFYIVYIYIDS